MMALIITLSQSSRLLVTLSEAKSTMISAYFTRLRGRSHLISSSSGILRRFAAKPPMMSMTPVANSFVANGSILHVSAAANAVEIDGKLPWPMQNTSSHQERHRSYK